MRSIAHLPGRGAPFRLLAGAVVAAVLPAAATAAPVTSFIARSVPGAQS